MISIQKLAYTYPDGCEVFKDFSVELPAGSRTLLVGANGTGKSTLLRLMGGRMLVPRESVTILGGSPFHDLALTNQIALIEGDLPLNLDLRVSEVLAGQPMRVDRNRQAELIRILGIDPNWRMSRVSSGQRKRVQILLALEAETRVFLLDEITAHLDVLVRSDLMEWLRAQKDVTIVYATHIFDGLWDESRPWPTHLLVLGKKTKLIDVEKLEALTQSAGSFFRACEKEIRAQNPSENPF